MATTAGSTPFPLGAYLNEPNPGDPTGQASFETNYASFTALMGTAPAFLDYYIDYTQPVADWVSNASFQAYSAAQTPESATATPVIALPMYSLAAGALTPDQQYQAIISGQDDNVLTGLVNAWVAQGFTSLVFRPGWEMNIPGDTFAGVTAQDQADWVAAFQHIYTVLHQAAATAGAAVTVVWNPATINYETVDATTTLYPGASYVDAIGADSYSDIFPYADTTNPLVYHDWNTGGEDTSVAQFIADPINREHYWSYPAATEWALDSSGGHDLSLDNLIQFAEQQGKPFAIPETGAGASNSGTDVTDDAAYPAWLAAQLTAAQAAGETIDFVNLWDSNAGSNYEFSNASDNKPQEAAAWAQYFGTQTNQTVQTLCFCRGTLIRTPTGEIPVEALSIGDDVTTSGGMVRRVTWIGTGRVLATRGRRNAATPVIVRKDALADNVPYRDLHVTKGHSFLMDGALIPAEFLVNHRSIIWDDRAQEVSLYHIELATHDVLIANGAPAESYRDAGNRWLFQNCNRAWDDPPKPPYAPVLTGGALVDRVWRRLLDRCGRQPDMALTEDPDLHLLIDYRRVDPYQRVGSAFIFRLAAGAASIRIASRSVTPAELGLARDPRLLGVALVRLVLREGNRFRIIEATDARLVRGFHDYEPDCRVRWTNGDAVLPGDLFEGFGGATELVLHLGGTTQYAAGRKAA